jgi:NAD+ synthase (glutamine-hydrolysing)
MRIALAQINPTLGDFKSNAEKIIQFAKRASEKRADLVVFSELTLCGYPPNDALERPEFVQEADLYLKKVIKATPKNLSMIFGTAIVNPKSKKTGGKLYQNVAVVSRPNKKPIFVAKQLLPSYDVFDDTRFFEPGTETGIVTIPRVGKVAISVCEDMWAGLADNGAKIYSHDPLRAVKKVELEVNISASPFSKNKMNARFDQARRLITQHHAPFVYVNQVGGQDELIFDGRSFILDRTGKIVVQAAPCDEDLLISDLATKRSEHRPQDEDEYETLRKVLVLGLRDFVRKTNQNSVHLGLSGGIDSALVAALSVDAFGPGRVTGVLLPGPYSSEGSVADSLKLAKNLGIKTFKVDINSIYSEFVKVAEDFPKISEFDSTEQNLQARIRGMILMAFSNRSSSMLLSTANKCELATGYSTLYGDTCGGLMPIGDLLKGEIYSLAKLYNHGQELIPKEIIEKAPSAELAPDQKDSDILPPYDVLDKAVKFIVEEKGAAKTKIQKWLLKSLQKSEFKRWQAPPILRVSEHGFGRGRRMPVAGLR